MTRLLLASALFVSGLIAASESHAQHTTVSTDSAAHRAGTDEPWMYPVEFPDSPTPKHLNSLTRSIGFVESRDVRIFTSTNAVVRSDVASFEEIVKWYSEKLGDSDLPKSLASFNQATNDNERVHDGVSKSFIAAPAAHTRFRYTPDQKQITVMVSLENGDVVAVSLLGANDETSINVMRHHANRDGGSPVVDRMQAATLFLHSKFKVPTTFMPPFPD